MLIALQSIANIPFSKFQKNDHVIANLSINRLLNSILLQTAKQGQQVIKISGPGLYYTFQRKEIHITSYSYVATVSFSNTSDVSGARTNGENRTDVQH